jgi:Rieske Fe-S protein
MTAPHRRELLAGACLLGLAGSVGACAASGTAGSGNDPAAATKAGNPSGGTAIGKTSEIPVGGGKVFTDASVVVTQPTAGDYQAFTAICTHARCVVTQVISGTINCPCHGSRFDAATGAVAVGPAKNPLPHAHIQVSGDQIVLFNQ